MALSAAFMPFCLPLSQHLSPRHRGRHMPSSIRRQTSPAVRRASLRAGICGIGGIFEPSPPAFGLSEPLSMFRFREYPQNRDSRRSHSRRKPRGDGSLRKYRRSGLFQTRVIPAIPGIPGILVLVTIPAPRSVRRTVLHSTTAGRPREMGSHS
jgi:hypothetical protein